ncbi:hypothetical protein CRUP_019510 [Coryphaenoides rupestris]|nr:hypothetical protein CRUP_019510 [Coryphaenoides rupestris]
MAEEMTTMSLNATCLHGNNSTCPAFQTGRGGRGGPRPPPAAPRRLGGRDRLHQAKEKRPEQKCCS